MHRPFYTQKTSCTQILLHTKFLHTHTNPLTHRSIYTETLLHTYALHTDLFTHQCFCTQSLWHTNPFIEGSLEVRGGQKVINMDRWNSRGGKSQRGEEKKWEDQRGAEKRKSGKQEDAGAQKGRKAAIHCVFPMIWGSGGSKSNLAKAAGAEPAGQMRDEKIARRCGAKHICK